MMLGYHVDAALRAYNYKIVVCLRVYTFVYEMMSRLIAKGIIRSYSMRLLQRSLIRGNMISKLKIQNLTLNIYLDKFKNFISLHFHKPDICKFVNLPIMGGNQVNKEIEEYIPL